MQQVCRGVVMILKPSFSERLDALQTSNDQKSHCSNYTLMSSTNINYTHDHVFLGSAHDENAKRTLWVVALTVVMMVGEITAGYITGSMALLADGFHMATHAGALGIAAAAYGYAKRHASSQRYSFGTGKVGDLGGFASALILGMVSLGIGIESVMRLLQPTEVQFGTATGAASCRDRPDKSTRPCTSRNPKPSSRMPTTA